MAGLWNQVPTGWEGGSPPTLDTFTIITTEVCEPLAWLHTRMPVFVWDESLGKQWLDSPTEKIHNLLDHEARQTPKDMLDWHQVTTEMSSTKFRAADAIKPLPKEKSVKDYFMVLNAVSKSNKAKTRIGAPSPPKNKSKTSLSSSSGKTTTTQSTAKRKTAASPSPSSSKRSKVTTTPQKGTASSSVKKGPIEAFFQPKKKKTA